MILTFDDTLADGYKSGAQRARRLTEGWVGENMYCPRCGRPKLEHFGNNRPVADFFCPDCGSQYELKSKCGAFGERVNDGAYETMIARITGNANPDFMFMSYLPAQRSVDSLIAVPKHFFVPEIIEKRKPLSRTARRAGWTGCNILLNKIPEQGRIHIIDRGVIADKAAVVEKLNRASALEISDIAARGWLFDVLNCVNAAGAEFTLEQMYAFEHALAARHPDNHNIRPKIRQQLQMLRDRGYLEFLGRGKYRRI